MHRFPEGLGNDHDILEGKYIAFQNYRGSISASIDGFSDAYYYVCRRPVSPLMPNFRNVYKQEEDFQSGLSPLVFWGAYRNTAY